MKSVLRRGPALRTVVAGRSRPLLILAVLGGLAASPCLAGLVVQHDGTSLNGEIVSGQVWDVQSGGKVLKVPVADIIWMAGTEVKRFRVNKRDSLLTGRVLTKELLMQVGPESRSLPIPLIDFLCGKEIAADIHYVRIEEFGDQMVWVLGTGAGEGMRVELMPQGWENRVRISSPVYASTIACTANLGVRVTQLSVSAGGAASGGVGYVMQLSASMQGDDSDGSGGGTCRMSAMGSITKRRGSSVSVSFGTPFSMPGMSATQTQYFVGRGQIYLFAIPAASGKPASLLDAEGAIAAGKVLITRTASNILKLPITVTKPRP